MRHDPAFFRAELSQWPYPTGIVCVGATIPGGAFKINGLAIFTIACAFIALVRLTFACFAFLRRRPRGANACANSPMSLRGDIVRRPICAVLPKPIMPTLSGLSGVPRIAQQFRILRFSESSEDGVVDARAPLIVEYYDVAVEVG